MTAYSRLMGKYREIVLIDSTSRLLDWDLETHMPPQGLALRADQLGLLKRLRHRMLTSDELARLVKESEAEVDASEEVRSRNLYLLRREREIAVSVPEDLVAALANQTAISRDAWMKARAARDWKVFEPEFQKVVDLSIACAEATMDARDASCVYDAMIDDYEMGMTNGQVADLLGGLRVSLAPLVRKYSEASRDVDPSCIRRAVPLAVQREVVRDAVGLVGYDTTSDKARGRMDDTTHPFTTGMFDDVRIALRYREDGLIDSLLGGMHEAGHAMYDQNINHDWMYQPVGSAASMGVHEAMSRFNENIIGLSRGFWTFYLPRLKGMTGSAFSDLQLDDLLRAVNKVEPSKTRVAADEVTYALHIAIRFEIERELFAGRLKVSEIPHMWNDLYDKYLQVRFDDDAEGVLQDIHWSAGAFGYWQSYAMGNVYGSMFLRELEKDIPGWADEAANGRPGVAVTWLKDHVQHWGALYTPEALTMKVTGSSLTPEPFVRYLEMKHSALWG